MSPEFYDRPGGLKRVTVHVDRKFRSDGGDRNVLTVSEHTGPDWLSEDPAGGWTVKTFSACNDERAIWAEHGERHGELDGEGIYVCDTTCCVRWHTGRIWVRQTGGTWELRMQNGQAVA